MTTFHPAARLPLGPCQSFVAGHGTHWIMAKQFRNKGQPGTILGFRGNLTVVRLRSGEEVDWWHHHPRRLRAAARAHGGVVAVFPAVTALQIQGGWFYGSTEASPCGFLDGEGGRFGGTLTEDAYTHDALTYVDEAGDPIPDPTRLLRGP
ncbi:MAG: hypothetical protein ABI181_04285 [Mycobacteriaceae bacterium]